MRGFEEGVSRSRIFSEDFAFFFDCFDDSDWSAATASRSERCFMLLYAQDVGGN
jgi:hypothetical protein